MSMTRGAAATASRAANSKPLEALTRVGFIGYGIVHLLFAWLALQIAFGKSVQSGDQTGAMQTLAGKPLGKALLVAVAIGLLAMAIWQLSEAMVGHREERGRDRVLERVASVARTVMYGWFAWTAYKVVNDAGSSSGAQQKAMTQQLMSSPGGRWLIGLIGLGVLALGIGLIVYGVKKKFQKRLHTERMSARTRRLGRRLGVAGYSAKGIAVAITGVLVVTAAVKYDPAKARGLDAALRTLRDQSFGQFLLTLVALGIAAFAGFCVIQAKYRKV